jgi:hypothetical protein
MGRGTYLGGSTIIGPRSGWFSKTKRPKAKPKAKPPHDVRVRWSRAPEQVLQDTLQKIAERDKKRQEKQAREAAHKAEAELRAAEKRKKRIETHRTQGKKYPPPSFYSSVEVYKKTAGRIRRLRVGLDGPPAEPEAPNSGSGDAATSRPSSRAAERRGDPEQ